MLLAALSSVDFRTHSPGNTRRTCRQWQEELHHKFGLSDFQIYGKDFELNDSIHWKLHDRVIGSIDRFKSDRHLEILMQSGRWDLVVLMRHTDSAGGSGVVNTLLPNVSGWPRYLRKVTIHFAPQCDSTPRYAGQISGAS